MHDIPERPHPRAVVAVRGIHTAVFAVELASILWLVVSGLVGRRDRSVAVAAGLVASRPASSSPTRASAR